MFLAHIRMDKEGPVRQLLTDHCRNTARYAGACLNGTGLEHAGELLGMIHDCGKFKEEFQNYLVDSNGTRGSVNHTFAGARLLIERYHSSNNVMQRLATELLAFASGSHHGLFDCVDENKKSGFEYRLTKGNIGYDECVKNFFDRCALPEELDKLFSASVEELSQFLQRLVEGQDNYAENSFKIGLLARLLLSALIEGDRRDTAEFMTARLHHVRSVDWSSFWRPYRRYVEEKISHFSIDSAISKARCEISNRCRIMAEEPGGIYRLNVPTGAGKTLTSLRYALAHGEKWSKQRLIFTSPLLSILEQNAAVVREYIGDDSIILEHHSNILHAWDDEMLDQRELAVENWDAPIIITTLAQLLNTLFDAKTTAIRRFQSLCNSVIVIDEVQTVPPRMLSLFNMAVDFLAKVCSATVVLCSATQPCLEKTDHPIKVEIRDMITYDEKLWEPFRRTVITDAGYKTLEEIADFARTELEQTDSLLLVCNRKDEAEYLFSELRAETEEVYHLSASMCTAHRRVVLAELNAALDAGKKCLCVATQVIEAGVDISFCKVIRLAAGMDSVIQAAGRCNRHGESTQPVPVYVVSCLGENLGHLREIREAKQATQALLYNFQQNAELFENDLSSDSAIMTYYQKLYQNMAVGYQDYSIEKPETSLFELLSDNLKFYNEDAVWAEKYMMNQAFKLAGNRFEVFEGGTRDLIVPYGKGAELIAELAGHPNPDAAFLAKWSSQAKFYSVAVYEWQLKRLGNAVTEYAGAAVLSEGFYDEDTGLVLKPVNTNFLEV